MWNKPDIITATVDHAQTLADLGQVTFTESYLGMQYYNEDIVAGYCSQAFNPEKIRAEISDPKVRYRLLRISESWAGYGKLIERAPPACIAHLNAVCLQRIYLARPFQSRGLGLSLLRALSDEAAAMGYSHLWLTVWEHNTAAVRFYQRHGFAYCGTWEWAFTLAGRRYADTDWIFVRDLNLAW